MGLHIDESLGFVRGFAVGSQRVGLGTETLNELTCEQALITVVPLNPLQNPPRHSSRRRAVSGALYFLGNSDVACRWAGGCGAVTADVEYVWCAGRACRIMAGGVCAGSSWPQCGVADCWFSRLDRLWSNRRKRPDVAVDHLLRGARRVDAVVLASIDGRGGGVGQWVAVVKAALSPRH